MAFKLRGLCVRRGLPVDQLGLCRVEVFDGDHPLDTELVIKLRSINSSLNYFIACSLRPGLLPRSSGPAAGRARLRWSGLHKDRSESELFYCNIITQP